MAAGLTFYEIDGLVVASELPMRAPEGFGPPALTIRVAAEPLAGRVDPTRFTTRFPGRPVMAQVGDSLVVKMGSLLEARIGGRGSRADVWIDRDLDQPALNELLIGQLIPLAFARRPGTIVLRGEVRSIGAAGNILIAGHDDGTKWARVGRDDGAWLISGRRLVAVVVVAEDHANRRPPPQLIPPAAAVTELVTHSFMAEPSGAIADLLDRYGALVDDVAVFQLKSRRDERLAAIERAMDSLFERLG